MFLYNSQIVLGIVFGVIVGTMLALDLGVLHRRSRAPSLRQAALWTIIWVSLALGFNVAVYKLKGPSAALEFFHWLSRRVVAVHG